MRVFFRKKIKFNKNTNKTEQGDKQIPKPLFSDLDKNLDILCELYKECSDVVFRTFLVAGHTKAQLIYIKGLSNVEEMDNNVLTPLMKKSEKRTVNPKTLIEETLSVAEVVKISSFEACIEQLSVGNPILLLEGDEQGFALGLAKWERRAVEEPTGELVVRGPREGFTETLEVNTSLLRRKIKSPQLKIKTLKLGRYTQTTIALAYIEDLADETLIEEINQRLERIDIDGILESGYIEELIQDNSYTPFPQVLISERPDTAVSSLLEGRVVIIVDGTPFVLIAPTTFFSLFQSGEDYYHHFLISTATRWLRYLFCFISLLLPSLYVAVITYHQEMVPTTLLLTMVDSREVVPFPALVEALLMEITFEGLREAGLRLPKQVGAACQHCRCIGYRSSGCGCRLSFRSYGYGRGDYWNRFLYHTSLQSCHSDKIVALSYHVACWNVWISRGHDRTSCNHDTSEHITFLWSSVPFTSGTDERKRYEGCTHAVSIMEIKYASSFNRRI